MSKTLQQQLQQRFANLIAFFGFQKNHGVEPLHQKPLRGFWQKLVDEKILKGETLSVLAPMADVTDIAFRTMIAKYSKPTGPDVMWTEFVSADGLCSVGREVLKRDLEFGEIERPIVAQLFSSTPENMKKAAALCRELGFDGIDINMGCPDKSIEKQGAGAAHMKDWRLAQKVIRAAQEGAVDIPVSVKTRLGFNKIEYKEWLPKILEMNVPVLTVHLRTRKEMSKVDAHWNLMSDVAKLVREKTGEVKDGGTILLGNGDVKSVRDGKEKANSTGCDGVMIGRAIFGTPWLFGENNEIEKTLEERLKILVEHTKLFEEKLGDIKNFAIMKKHYKAYVHGFDGAKELRMDLMECDNSREIEEKINLFIDKLI
ncbi:MAG: tRNA-dihydrouridine synthase [Candidatus Nomurabacteria bacterium]|nr:tRNA-dihydrouridine synthase [Candidatus Nomurabacteria bacterium]